MRTHSPLVLDVHEVLEHPGVQRPIAFEAPSPDIRAGLSRVRGDLSLDLVLEAIEGGVHVRGTVSGAYAAECRRCLEPVTRSFAFEGAEVFRPTSEVWEEGYVVKEGVLDLEPMVRDVIALGLPTNPVCRADCKGLCSRCGSDLNEGECACPEEPDPRWSALSELGRQLRKLDG